MKDRFETTIMPLIDHIYSKPVADVVASLIGEEDCMEMFHSYIIKNVLDQTQKYESILSAQWLLQDFIDRKSTNVLLQRIYIDKLVALSSEHEDNDLVLTMIFSIARSILQKDVKLS